MAPWDHFKWRECLCKTVGIFLISDLDHLRLMSNMIDWISTLKRRRTWITIKIVNSIVKGAVETWVFPVFVPFIIIVHTTSVHWSLIQTNGRNTDTCSGLILSTALSCVSYSWQTMAVTCNIETSRSPFIVRIIGFYWRPGPASVWGVIDLHCTTLLWTNNSDRSLS